MIHRAVCLVSAILLGLAYGVWRFGPPVLIGVLPGLLLGLVWHWWIFARYDEWIIDNGGRLPPEEKEGS